MTHTLMRCYGKLRDGRMLSQSDAYELAGMHSMNEVQAASLLAGVSRPQRNAVAAQIAEHLVSRFPRLLGLTDPTGGPSATAFSNWEWSLIDAVRRRVDLGIDQWKLFATAVSAGQIATPTIAYILMTIAIHGLSTHNTRILAEAMRDSGAIYDYRQSVRPRRLIRRYPTGGLSEKTALILPSLIHASSSQFPIASNFLVAKSLGFTGGTWDKLRAIPGFQFPMPGNETLRILTSENVVMCVTQEDVAPADRILYQIRSMSGTIESVPLIITSICSKQGAVPADFLLLDVRYGSGAFLSEKPMARRVSSMIEEIMNSWGLRCDSVFTDTRTPTGCCIGNACEVAEAVAVMSATRPLGPWVPRLLELQWEIVRGFFAKMVNCELSDISVQKALEYAERLRRDGSLIRSFYRLLCSHGVSSETADLICRRPWEAFFSKLDSVAISANKDGVISGIDQPRLGHFLNFTLRVADNEFDRRQNVSVGCVLSRIIGDHVQQGEQIAAIVGLDDETATNVRQNYSEVCSCFSISSSPT